MRKFFAVLAVLATVATAAWADEPVTFLPNGSQRVAVSGTQATSSALGAQTYVVRLVCTEECYVAVSDAFTTSATTKAVFLPADSPEYFRVRPTNTIVVIQSSASGNLHITEMTR